MVSKQWLILPPMPPNTLDELSSAGFSDILCQLMFNRGIQTQNAAIHFIHGDPGFDNHPLGLKGMKEAVDCITRAMNDESPIVIYGDYDVDGVTATALLVMAIRKLGGKVQEYIPDRFSEGYGLNKAALDYLNQSGSKLVICVDCGIRAHDEIAYGNDIGMDFIICDHHKPGSGTPPAKAVIDPKQFEDQYPNKNLAAVGLAFKLASALFEAAYKDPGEVNEFLDLVALGTIADIADLTSENRSLVIGGLEKIRNRPRLGLQKLIRIAGLSPENITASDISFILAPRINATGRLDSAMVSYRLLTCEDPLEALKLAQEAENLNQKRQILTKMIQAEAENLALSGDKLPLLLFAAHPDFHRGVIGLAASRLVERYYRPAVVAQKGELFTHASCRSIPEFDITRALDQCSDLLERYGGHKAAAGFTILNKHMPALENRLGAIAEEELADKTLEPVINVDMEVSLNQISFELLKEIDFLEPTGYGNPRPKFVTRNLHVKELRGVGKDGAHLKLILQDRKITISAIAFRQGFWLKEKPKRIDILYSVELNDFNGIVSLQLNVLDIKESNGV